MNNTQYNNQSKTLLLNREGKILIFKVLDLLETQFHNEEFPPEISHEEPLDGLVLTILSQNTNDKNRDLAFKNLKENYQDYQSIINSGNENLEKIIKPAGLGATKSLRIINILKQIRNDFGEYSLKKLSDYSRDEAWNYLINMQGVGTKTVACVLLFDLKMRAFPVDTHVSRITRRLGVVPEKTSADEISLLFENIVPESRCLGGHVNMIAHGRATCHSRNPDCNNCVLREFCKYIK